MSVNYCPNCGTANEGANFCPNCGRQLTTTTKTQVAANSDGHQPSFAYPKDERHSEIINRDKDTSEQVVEFRRLHPNAVWLFAIQYLMRTSIILLLCLATILIEPLMTIGLLIAYIAVIYIVAKLNYNHYRFEVAPRSFRKEHGIFHKHTVSIAFGRIQNINVRRGIIDRMLGLAHLEIETAGTGGKVERQVTAMSTFSEGYIPGITAKEAHDIRALMMSRLHQGR